MDYYLRRQPRETPRSPESPWAPRGEAPAGGGITLEITGSWILVAHPPSEVEPRRVCVCERCQVTEIGSKPHAEGAKHVRWTMRTTAFNLQCPQHIKSTEVISYACEINRSSQFHQIGWKCEMHNCFIQYFSQFWKPVCTQNICHWHTLGREGISVFIYSHEMIKTHN